MREKTQQGNSFRQTRTSKNHPSEEWYRCLPSLSTGVRAGVYALQLLRHPNKAGIHDTGTPGKNNTDLMLTHHYSPTIWLPQLHSGPCRSTTCICQGRCLSFWTTQCPKAEALVLPGTEEALQPSLGTADEYEQHAWHSISPSKRGHWTLNRSCIGDCTESEEPSPWSRLLLHLAGMLWHLHTVTPHLQAGCRNHFLRVPVPFYHF